LGGSATRAPLGRTPVHCCEVSLSLGREPASAAVGTCPRSPLLNSPATQPLPRAPHRATGAHPRTSKAAPVHDMSVKAAPQFPLRLVANLSAVPVPPVPPPVGTPPAFVASAAPRPPTCAPCAPNGAPERASTPTPGVLGKHLPSAGPLDLEAVASVAPHSQVRAPVPFTASNESQESTSTVLGKAFPYAHPEATAFAAPHTPLGAPVPFFASNEFPPERASKPLPTSARWCGLALPVYAHGSAHCAHTADSGEPCFSTSYFSNTPSGTLPRVARVLETVEAPGKATMMSSSLPFLLFHGHSLLSRWRLTPRGEPLPALLGSLCAGNFTCEPAAHSGPPARACVRFCVA